MTTDQSLLPPEPPIDIGYSDLISSIVTRGYGTIATGNDMMVVYGPAAGHFIGKRVTFISNNTHAENAERLLREAVLQQQAVKK